MRVKNVPRVGSVPPMSMNLGSAMRTLVGWLVVVELVSGILQGYYTPLYTDIARHLGIHDADVNIFEAAQLMVSAVCVPVFAKLGDTLGYRRMLLWSSAITAIGSWAVVVAPTSLTFTLAWAVQGAYVAWLPLDVALISARARPQARGEAGGPVGEAAAAHRLTAKGSGIIVAALQAGAIIGAVAGGQLGVFAPSALPAVLAVPAVCVTVVVLVVATRVPEAPEVPGGSLDVGGAVWLSLALLGVGTGLTVLRLQGLGSPPAWGLVALGLLLFIPFVRHEMRSPDPLIDIRVVRGAQMWPIIVASFLFGVGVLGAQGPLSTFARTDPAVYGYGLGLTSIGVSGMILGYVLATLTGALMQSPVVRRLGGRRTLLMATVVVTAGYAALLALHGQVVTMLGAMVLIGVGNGALIAALPAAAASAAPPHRTAMATGLNNTTKTVGGMVASAVFALALLSGSHQTLAGEDGTAGSLSGYLTVWIVCAVTALVAAVFLAAAPRGSFEGSQDAGSSLIDEADPAGPGRAVDVAGAGVRISSGPGSPAPGSPSSAPSLDLALDQETAD